MSEGLALNGKSLSQVATSHAALISGEATSAYDGVENFNRLLKDSMRQFLKGEENAIETFQAALKERSALLSSPEIRSNPQAKDYLESIVVRGDDPATSLAQTVAMHGFVDDPTYKGETPAADADEGASEPVAIL